MVTIVGISTKGDTNYGYYCWNFRKSEEAFV